MFYNFDIWNCLGKINDAFLMAYIPMRVFQTRKFVKNKLRMFTLSFVAISIVFYGIDMVFKPVNFILTLMLYITIGLLYTCCIYRDRLYLKMIVQSTCVCCTMLMHFIVVSTLTIVFSSFMLFTWEHILTSAILSLLLLFFLTRFPVIPKIDLPSKYGIGMASLTLMLAFVTNSLLSMNFGTDAPWFRVGFNAIMMVVVLFLYFLFFSMVREYEGKKLQEQQLDMQRKYLKESTESYGDMLRLRHELKNHIFCMNTLLEQKKYNHLADYFSQVYRTEYTIDMIASGNNMINAVLNQKVAYAKSKGIPIKIGAAAPESPGIDESHICAVISNLLDNAIEACEQLPAPEISMTVNQIGKYIHISCKNTVSFDVLKENGALVTTKKGSHHGLGLQVVQRIVDAHQGMIEFHMESLVFIVNAMLKTG